VTIPDFNKFGGRHTEVSALKNTLQHLGVSAPHSGGPYSEQLLFGIGGGIGFAYFLFERAGAHQIQLGVRIHTKETERPEFFQEITRRLCLPLQPQNSSSATAAATNLKRHLEEGRTPIVSVDPSRLPYLGLNVDLHTYYSVVVFGVDEEGDRVLLSDRCEQPVSVTREEFRRARESSWSPKFRAVAVGKPAGEPDVRGATIEGIRQCCQQMNGGLGITNFGLRGLEKWATVLTSTKEKKSWPKVFAPGPALYEALFSVFAQISTRGATGHASRSFYAEFLEEAASLLSRPGLRDAAEQYRRCDEVWAEVAEQHLPSSVPAFKETKELAMRRRQLFETRGPGASDEIRHIRERLADIKKETGENFPLSPADARALFNDLRQRILKLRDAEAEAVRVLESAIT
jgi:hypothetical protein